MRAARIRLAILAAAVLGLAGGLRPAAAGQAEQVAALRAILLRLPKGGWAEARRELGAFDQANPALGPEASEARRVVVVAVEKARVDHFRTFTGRRLEPIVRERIRGRVTLKTSTHQGELRWIQDSAERECLEALRAEVCAQDPGATDPEIAQFWAERPERQGEFRRILEPVDRYSQEPGAWGAESLDRRVDYLFARFLLASALFEVSPKRDHVPCERCDGEGTVTFRIGRDEQVTVLCPSCRGRRRFDALRYR